MPPIWHLTLSDNRLLSGHISDVPKGATLCFSMMAPVALKTKGQVLRSVGGYTEIMADFDQTFAIAFQDDAFEVFNIGWLPQGAYVRCKDGCCVDVEIDFSHAETLEMARAPQAKSTGLRLVPQPTH